MNITELLCYDWIFPRDDSENEQLAITTAGQGPGGQIYSSMVTEAKILHQDLC